MRIDVCLASYCGARFLREQIDSILMQLGPGDRLLVSDDGSSDETVDIVLSYGERVRLVSSERAGGVVPNFERVLRAADADLVVLADQDDVWLHGRLDIIRNSLLQHDLVLLNGSVVDENLVPHGSTIFQVVRMSTGFLSNVRHNTFVGCCMAFRRSLLDRVLPFPSGLPWHDWYIGLVAELTGSVARVDAQTLLYRRHGGNFSPTGEKSKTTLWQKLQLRVAVLRAVAIAVGFRSRSA